MKLVRILLLVLLAFMLPVRGVMAAAMLCPPQAGAGQGAQAMPMGGAGGHLHLDGGEAAHDHGGADHPADGHATGNGHHHAGASGTDTCNLCTACCAVPPLPSAGLHVPQPHGLVAADFPSFAAPAPTFLSDGQERPPRSI